jgi:hypothetical protein
MVSLHLYGASMFAALLQPRHDNGNVETFFGARFRKRKKRKNHDLKFQKTLEKIWM